VVFVLGESQDSNFHRACLADEFLEARTAQESEIASRRHENIHLLQTATHIPLGLNASGASDLLIARQRDPRRINAGLIEERLMPGDVRSRLPTFVVIEGEHRQPVAEKGYVLPLTP